jgi:hypothetical protein
MCIVDKAVHKCEDKNVYSTFPQIFEISVFAQALFIHGEN